jgi:hypothetical protein
VIVGVAPICRRAHNLLYEVSHSHFVDMTEQDGGVLVHAIGTGVFQFVLPLASRQESGTQCMDSMRSQRDPNTTIDVAIGTCRRAAAAGKRSASGFGYST